MADAGVTDAGMDDAGVTDAGMDDAGVTDSGMADAGVTDSGIADAGETDAGTADAGTTDAGMTDAGPGPVDPMRSTISLDRTTAIANGVDAVTATITLSDAEGNPIPNVVVTLTTSGTATIAAPAVTNASGQTIATLTSTAVETDTLTAGVGGVTLAQNPSVQFTAGPAAKLAFTVEPTVAQAGVAISPAIQVTVEDAQGHPILTDSSSVSVTLSTGALAGTTTVAAANGVASFSDLSVAIAGSGYTLTASDAALSAATSTPFSITAGPPARAVFTTSPGVTAAGQSLSPAVVVSLEDAEGNVITTATDAVGVAIGTQGGAGTLAGTTTLNAVAGVARFSDLSIDKAGTGYTLVAFAEGYQGSTSGAFDIVPGAISGTRSSLTVSAGSVIADGTSFATLTVTVMDADQNPIANQLVTFGASGVNNLFNPTTCTTDPSGECSVTISSPTAQAETITATFGAVSATTGITFVPGTVSGARSTITLDRATATADGADTVTATITVTDAAGNPIANAFVWLTASGRALIVESLPTDSNGKTTARLTSTAVETDTLTAVVGSVTLDAHPAVQFVAGPAARLAFTVQPSNAQIGAPISPAIQVTVEDAQSHPVPTDASPVTVTLSTGTLAGTTTVSAVGGIATFADLSVATVATGYSLTATDGSLTAATSNEFAVTPGPPAKAVFTSSPTTTQAGAFLGPLVAVTLEDAAGNVITTATAPVTVAIGTHGGPGTLSGTSTVIPGGGVAYFGDLSINKVGVGYTLVSSVDGYQGGTSTAFDIVPGLVSGTQSSVTVSGSPVADGVSFATLTATILDANQNPIGEQVVYFLALAGESALSATTCTTDDVTGECSVTIWSTIAHTEQVTVVSGALDTQATVTFVPGAPAAASSIGFSPSSLTAGVDSATISVLTLDGQGNRVPHAAVSLAASEVANTFMPASGTSDAYGQFSATLTTPVAQSETVTATIGITNPVEVTSDPIIFNAGAPSTLASSIAAQPASLVAGTSATITVTAIDVHANVIPNAPVTLSSSGSGNTFTPASGMTAADGTFVATLSSPVAQTETVIATIGTNNPIQLTSAALTFTPGVAAAALSTATSSLSSVVAGTSTTITVTVEDAFGNGVPSAGVSLTASGSTNTFTPASGTTDSNGVFTASLSSTVAQTETVTASVDAATPFSVTTAPIVFGPAAVSATNSTVVLTGSPLPIDGTTQATVTVTAVDIYGNAEAGATVALSAPPAVTVHPEASQTANANGVAVFLLTATSAGSTPLPVTVNGILLTTAPELVLVYPVIGAVVAPVKISGAVSGCTTAASDTSRKIAMDAANQIYVVMNCGGTGYVTTSKDGGATWSAPVSTGVTGVTSTNELHIAAGAAREVYVVGYSNTSTILYTMSSDGGATWSSLTTISSTAQQPYGLAYPSVEVDGTSVFVAELDGSPSGTKVYSNTNSGTGGFTYQGETPMVGSQTFYWRLLVDPVSGHLYDVNEVNQLYVSASTDAVHWGPVLEIGSPAGGYLTGGYSAWALGGGYIYNGGATSLASRIALADIDQADPAPPGTASALNGTPLTGLQASAHGQSAVDADAAGNAYFVTTTGSGEIDVQGVLADSTSLSGITQVVASGGANPVIQAGPKGATLVSYTSGGAVYSAVVVPQLAPTPGTAITTAVAPIKISGSVASCSTEYSNTSQKIATDAGNVIYALMNCGGTAYVAVSHNGGASFAAPVNTGISGVILGTDEMTIAAGALGTAWVAGYTSANTVAFSYTNNGGATWSTPSTVGSGASPGIEGGLVSVAAIGSNVWVAFQSASGTKVYENTNDGAGAFGPVVLTSMLNSEAAYWRLLADQGSGDLFDVAEDQKLYVSASSNGGGTWGPTVQMGTVLQGWSAWASGGGYLYNAGGTNTAFRIAVSDAANPTSVPVTSIGGVVVGQHNQTTIAADSAGNAFIVSTSAAGAIIVQAVLPSLTTAGPSGTVVASGGSWPAIVAGEPGTNAALVTYTLGGVVYASVVVAPADISCPGGPQNDCGGVCTDVLTDNANCGSCGTVCANGSSCCGGTCINTTSDQNNCGGCGIACGRDTPAEPRDNCCNSTCVPFNDDNHCGSCGNACPSNGGSCTANGQCTCYTGQTLCPGTCAFLDSDNDNCGACGHSCGSDPNAHCSGGTCQCYSGYTYCSGVCLLPFSDNNNCGGCGLTCSVGAGGIGTASCSGADCTCSLQGLGAIACRVGASSTSSCEALGHVDPNVCAPGESCYCGNYNGNDDCGCCGHKCPDGYQCVLGLCDLK
jgi:hypothetical protein